MNERNKLELIRDLAKSKLMELPPFHGEEMNLADPNPRRDGFVDGERTLAALILRIVDDERVERPTADDKLEEEMVLSLGQT